MESRSICFRVVYFDAECPRKQRDTMGRAAVLSFSPEARRSSQLTLTATAALLRASRVRGEENQPPGKRARIIDVESDEGGPGPSGRRPRPRAAHRTGRLGARSATASNARAARSRLFPTKARLVARRAGAARARSVARFIKFCCSPQGAATLRARAAPARRATSHVLQKTVACVGTRARAR